MSSPQLENGYIKISNELMDAFSRSFPGFTEGQIVLCVLRKTYGWHKKNDRISISQLVQMTGRSRRMVIYALQNLEAKKMIFVSRSFQEINEITFNKNYSEWKMDEKALQYQKLHLVQKVAPSAKNGTELVQHSVNSIPKVAPTKETLTKDTIQKISVTPKVKREPVSEVQRVVLFLEKTLNTKIVNFPKEARAWKAMHTAGYTEEQICAAISLMWTEDYWRQKGFDLVTVSNQIPKIAATAKDQNQRERAQAYTQKYEEANHAVDN